MKKQTIKATLSRAALHTPLGALTAHLGGAPAVLIVVLFLSYEISQDWRIQDNAYIDIKSFMVGYIGFFSIGVFT